MSELQIIKYQKVLEDMALHLEETGTLEIDSFYSILKSFELDLHSTKGCFKDE